MLTERMRKMKRTKMRKMRKTKMRKKRTKTKMRKKRTKTVSEDAHVALPRSAQDVNLPTVNTLIVTPVPPSHAGKRNRKKVKMVKSKKRLSPLKTSSSGPKHKRSANRPNTNGTTKTFTPDSCVTKTELALNLLSSLTKSAQFTPIRRRLQMSWIKTTTNCTQLLAML